MIIIIIITLNTKLHDYTKTILFTSAHICALPVLQLMLPDGKAKATELADNLVNFLPVSDYHMY